MQTVPEIVYDTIRNSWERATMEERKVMEMLWLAYKDKKPRVTQRDIATATLGLGSHEVYETVPTKKGESTMRKVRQIIRDLRLNYGVPILSDVKGYYLPSTITECEEAIARLEGMARAQSAAYYETYRAMERTIGVKSKFFDHQRPLFETADTLAI